MNLTEIKNDIEILLEHKINKAQEEVNNLTNETPRVFSQGKLNAYREIYGIITNHKGNG